MYVGYADIEKNVIDFIDRMNFIALVNVNNILGNIDYDLYKGLTIFYTERNEFAHNMIGIDFNDTDVIASVKTLTSRGLDLCRKISKIHDQKLGSA